MCTAAFVNKLYSLQESTLSGEAAAASVVVVTVPDVSTHTAEAMRWHRRFAHLGFETLARMASLNLLSGCSLRPADFLQAWIEIDCEACIETKQMGKPHTTPSTRLSTVPLGRAFSDVTGNATDGYFVTFLCEAAKWAASRALMHKSAAEVFAFISETVATLERQTGYNLKRLNCSSVWLS